jgi:hypothetical protein
MTQQQDLCKFNCRDSKSELIDSLPKDGERNVLITSALPCKLFRASDSAVKLIIRCQ